MAALGVLVKIRLTIGVGIGIVEHSRISMGVGMSGGPTVIAARTSARM